MRKPIRKKKKERSKERRLYGKRNKKGDNARNQNKAVKLKKNKRKSK